MLEEKRVKAIESKLNDLADVYYTTANPEVRECNRGYCQGVAFILSEFGYAVEWDNGKAIIVKED